MRWFFISERCILPFQHKSEAYEFAVVNQTSPKAIKEINLRPFKPLTCLQWLNQVIRLCENGHNLQSALMTQEHTNFNATSQYQIIAIRSLLHQGESVSVVLSFFLPKSIRLIAAHIPKEGTEESKLAALIVSREVLTNQIQLSQQLLKSLNYPAAIIQAALILAVVNKLLTHESIIQISTVWTGITCITLVFYYWVGFGYAYPFLCKHIASFRKYNTLSMLLALLKSGEPLQNAISRLCSGSAGKDQLLLYKCMLLLRSGAAADEALPNCWFMKTDLLQLKQLASSGDLYTPIEKAIRYWKDRNESILKRLSQAFPILGIVIAAVFVTHTLVALYAPLMDVNTFGF